MTSTTNTPDTSASAPGTSASTPDASTVTPDASTSTPDTSAQVPVSTVITTGGFKRQAHPFWLAHKYETDTPGVTFKDRGGRSKSVVVKHNERTRKSHVKLWFDSYLVNSDRFTIDGVDFTVPHQGDGFFTGEVQFDDMHRLLGEFKKDSPPPPKPDPVPQPAEFVSAETEPVPGEDFLDACLEVRFGPSTDRHGNLIGHPLHVPAWLGLSDIRITPPTTSGGWHQIWLKCSGLIPAHRHGFWVPMLRINDVWCYLMPSSGQYGTNVMAQADPDEMDVIRAYGQDDAVVIDALPNEPIPPRNRTSVKQVLIRLRRAGRREEVESIWESWFKDVKRHFGLTIGLAGMQGQIDIFARMAQTRRNQIAASERHVEASYGRARKRGETRSQEDWLEQTGRHLKYVRESLNRRSLNRKSLEYHQKNLAYQLERQKEMRLEAAEILERLEEREEDYEEFIPQLYGPR